MQPPSHRMEDVARWMSYDWYCIWDGNVCNIFAAHVDCCTRADIKICAVEISNLGFYVYIQYCTLSPRLSKFLISSKPHKWYRRMLFWRNLKPHEKL